MVAVSFMEMGDGPVNHLLARRDAIVEEVSRVVPAEVPSYAAYSAEGMRAVSERLVDFYLASLSEDRSDVVRTWAVDAFARRQQHGAPLVELLRGLGLVRRVLCREARALGPDDRVEGVIARLESVGADLVDAAVAGYECPTASATDALAVLEARYREIYQRTPAMMHSLDAEGRITAVSERWLATLGYTAPEVLGRRSVDFLTEESRRRAEEDNIPRVRADGSLFDVPYQLARKSGEVIDVRASSAAVRDERGDVVQFLTVFDDVTAELQATRAMVESEERWRALIELSPLPLCVHRAGIMLWLNDATTQLFGATSAEEMLGQNVMEFVHPDDRALVRARVREGMLHPDKALPPLEERYLRLDGAILYVEVAARSVMFHGERATQIALVNITARRQAEEARRLSEAQAQIIEAQVEALRALSTPLIPLGEGILVLPLVGRVTEDRAAQILEVLAEGVVAQRARVAILDVTGVPEADVVFAEALVRVAKTIRLLGAEVVITGMMPSLARTFVEIGADLGSLITCATLRDGITHARSPKRHRSS